MKTWKSSIKVSSSVAFTIAAIAWLTSSPTHAQSKLPANVAIRAQDACVEQARAKGFSLENVVSVESANADTVRVVLNLTQNGQQYKLTCNYNKASGTSVYEDTNSTTYKYQPLINPWLLGLVLPLVGLGLLWLWTRSRGSDKYDRYTRKDQDRRSEGIIRIRSDRLEIHSGPGTTYRITGNLRNGQRVILSGRYNNNWAELADGGWIPLQYVETNAQYTH
ncbi:SH3 domain-containing protein [Chlorogloeopsis sp. ULAP01]|uniref:SH3 domain-containing protein n=1 Tax=Chlorogloeopsis sp. ULAP01 TaxID=3056483 RepID=UPI0025AA97FD|nr:SH3 domain-containing protein [Chlorogloeopsis sp. ULAP01]MDM9384470.1 SH3 domain-containing protein [Chlorogloeopsis sp. ULAP01]